MSKTKIDWCDEVANIFTGCTGTCSYCYARPMARRIAAIPSRPGLPYRRVAEKTGDSFHPAFHGDVCDKLSWRLERARSPKRIFVGSMGDMCFDGEAVGYNIDSKETEQYKTADVQREVSIFARKLERSGHTILLLTKRPELLIDADWPANVHMGASVTGNSDSARVNTLLAMSDGFALKWVSVEPLLDSKFNTKNLIGMDWVVVGAQTGSTSAERTTEEREELRETASRIVDFCSANSTPVFIKDNLAKLAPDRKWPRQLPERKIQ